MGPRRGTRQAGSFLMLRDCAKPWRWNRYGCAERTDTAPSHACRSGRAVGRRCFCQLGGVNATACDGVLDWRSVRRDVRASACDEPRFTYARQVHHDRPCAAWMGVLRPPGDSAAEGQEAEVRNQSRVVGSWHGQARSAHQRRPRGQLHRLATCGQVARRSLLRRPRRPGDRHGAKRS